MRIACSMVLIGLFAVSCGGGYTGRPVSNEERSAVFEALRTKIEEIRTLDSAAQIAALTDFFSSRTEFEASGSDPSGAWARFVDGRILIVDNADVPEAGASSAPLSRLNADISAENTSPIDTSATQFALQSEVGSQQQAASSPSIYTHTPWENKVCLYRTCGYPPTGQTDWIDEVIRYLNAEENGHRRFSYQVVGNVYKATVDDLKSLPEGCGVFGIDSHASDMAKNRKLEWVYSIYTATPWSLDNEEKYKDLLNAGDLAYYHPMETVLGIPVEVPHYAITTSFVEKFWNLSCSVAYFNICRGFNSVSDTFRKMVLKKGASVYAGWTLRSLGETGNKTAAYVFDRLLGANLYQEKESPPQRPFGWDTLQADMVGKGLGTVYDDKYKGASELKFEAGNCLMGLLAPSVTKVTADTFNKKLYVFGVLEGFVPPASGISITAGGTQRSVSEHNGDAYVCTLPDNPAGDIYVTVRGQTSNTVKLSSYTGTFTYTITGPGTLKQVWTFTANLLGDLHDFRDEPGQTPLTHDNYVSMLENGSTGSVVASGTYNDGTWEVTWDGSFNLTPLLGTHGSSAPDRAFDVVGIMDADLPSQLTWEMYLNITSGVHEVIKKKNGDKWVTMVDGAMGSPWIGTLGFFPAAFKTPVVVTSNGTIQGYEIPATKMNSYGSSSSATGWTFNHSFKWNTITPQGTTGYNDTIAR